MKILFVDDDQTRHEEVLTRLRAGYTPGQGFEIYHAHDYVQALAMIAREEGSFDIICLDHDLGNLLQTPTATRELDGRGLAAVVAGLPASRLPRRVFIHSWNRPGALAMKAIFVGGRTRVDLLPFGPQFLDELAAEVYAPELIVV